MAQKIEEVKNKLNKVLNDQSKPWAGIFNLIEEKTGVQRLYICLGKHILNIIKNMHK